ncbi:MAG: tRNA pseudouridine(55) synthase TruB [Chlamydiota bacterium]|nr:tRNA pseudouridine(55) synthase TruB [Chlamydiota bacterium]
MLIDKEKGMTSFDVVRDVRRLTGEKKVGHSGTLDPLATGLLLVALGQGTKLLEYLIGCDKEYEVVARFGAVSDTYDAEGEITEVEFDADVSPQGDLLRGVEVDVASIIKEQFIGEIDQVPPKYSALKVSGKRACDIVRDGGEVEMKKRRVMIYGFDVVSFDWPEASFRVRCGSGTYIRSLVHDLGQLLGCGAYVSELRRTVVGDFSIENAVTADANNKIEQSVLSLEDVGRKFGFLELNDVDFDGLRDGKVLLDKKVEQGVPVMAFYKGKLVGVLGNSEKESGIKFAKVIF